MRQEKSRWIDMSWKGENVRNRVDPTSEPGHGRQPRWAVSKKFFGKAVKKTLNVAVPVAP